MWGLRVCISYKLPGEANAAGREAQPSNHDGLALAHVTLPQYQTHSGGCFSKALMQIGIAIIENGMELPQNSKDRATI